jgi:hypothetical protein
MSVTAPLIEHDVFLRLFALAADVMPYDLLLMTSHDDACGIVIEASSHADWPVGMRFGDSDSQSSVAGDFFALVDDRNGETLPHLHAGAFLDRMRTHSFRSMLVVAVPESEEHGALIVCARARLAFGFSDLRVAQRLARQFAGCASTAHEQPCR